MLLRKKKKYDVASTEKLADTLDGLREALLHREPDETSADCVQHVLMELWTQRWRPSATCRLRDPTICYLALSMLNRDGGFKEAPQATGPVAKFEYTMRLSFLVEAGRIMEEDPEGGEDAALDLIKRWLTEKVDSTFNSLRSLTHRATAITRGTMSMRRIWWLDNVTYQSLLYMGTPVHLKDIRLAFSAQEDLIARQWESKVLCGLDIRTEYGALSQDLTNKSVGYSFITDRRNASYFGDKDRLIRTILANPAQRSRFVVGKGRVAGKLMWNIPALKAWLYTYSLHQAQVVVRSEMLAGSAGRGTELTSMRRTNTPEHSGNLAVFGKHVALLVQYHKSGGLTGTDKLIPHSLDGFASDLLIQDLTLARPFAQMAVHICYPGDEDLRVMYDEALFVNNLRTFTTADLSALMGEFSAAIVGISLSVNSWRHISTSFSRKLCNGMQELLQEDPQTVPAAQACHTRGLEVRIYAVSNEALSGAAEDVLPLFLDYSTHWQYVCETVPGGLALPYREARSYNFKDLVASGVIKPPTGTSNRVSAQEVDLIAVRVAAQLEPTIAEVIEKAIASHFRPTGKLGVLARSDPALMRSFSLALFSPSPPEGSKRGADLHRMGKRLLGNPLQLFCGALYLLTVLPVVLGSVLEGNLDDALYQAESRGSSFSKQANTGEIGIV